MKNTLILLLSLLSLFSCNRKAEEETKEITINKFIFSSGSCYGGCHPTHLQIDENKRTLLFIDKSYLDENNLDTNKIGYFKGTISDSVFYLLESEIERIGLDNLNFDREGNEFNVCSDLPSNRLIIYHDGNLKSSSNWTCPSKRATKLESIIWDLCDPKWLNKTGSIFEIEGM